MGMRKRVGGSFFFFFFLHDTLAMIQFALLGYQRIYKCT
jgi:hypothetical protein